MTAVVHVVPTVALCSVLEPRTAVAVGLAVTLHTTVRLHELVRDRRRSRVVTRLVDEPTLAHWFAAVLSFFLWPVAFALLWVLVAFGASVAEPAVTAAVLAYGFSAVLAAWGVWVRRRLVRVAFVDVPIPGLAPDLDGYRIAHVTDLHIGGYDGKHRGFEWAARANRLSPDLVAVTGDLVTVGAGYYEDAAEVIGAFEAKDGVFVSLGNHDQWRPDELTRLICSKGPAVLRNASHTVKRGEGALVIAGIDDWSTGRDDLPRALQDRTPGAPTILLSHYPEFFPEAARLDVDLVLSGHTHGGQIGVPFVARRVNLASLTRTLPIGLHARGTSRLYLNPGLGTTGPPVRLGVPPEIALLTLRRA